MLTKKQVLPIAIPLSRRRDQSFRARAVVLGNRVAPNGAEVCAQVVSTAGNRFLVTGATTEGDAMIAFDVGVPFLNSELDEGDEVYVRLPAQWAKAEEPTAKRLVKACEDQYRHEQPQQQPNPTLYTSTPSAPRCRPARRRTRTSRGPRRRPRRLPRARESGDATLGKPRATFRRHRSKPSSRSGPSSFRVLASVLSLLSLLDLSQRSCSTPPGRRPPQDQR